MYDIFVGLFDHTLMTFKITPGTDDSTLHVVVYAALNTVLRAIVLTGFTYGAIRVVATAVSHGSF